MVVEWPGGRRLLEALVFWSRGIRSHLGAIRKGGLENPAVSEKRGWRTRRSLRRGAGETAVFHRGAGKRRVLGGGCGGIRDRGSPGGCLCRGWGSEWRQGRGGTSATRSRPVLTPKRGRNRVVIGGLCPPPEAPSDIKGLQPSKARPKASSLRPGPAGTGGRLLVPRGWRQHMQTERFARAFRFPPHLG